MPDGSYRSVSSPSEVGNYLALEHRTFPDGRPRLSFSLRGVWTICLNRKEYRDWVRPVMAAVQDQAGRSVGNIPGPDGDIFVDAALIKAVVGNSTSRRMRAAVDLVNARLMAEEVDRRVKGEVAAMLRSAKEGVRTRPEHEGALAAPAADVGGALPSVDVDDEGSGHALDRFVPVFERQLDGRVVLSVVARDVWTFLGVGRKFSDWFFDQVAKARLSPEEDYSLDVVFR